MNDDQDDGGASREPDAATVLAALPDPVVVVDQSASVVWGNTAAEEQFGWRPDAVVGRSALELVHPDDVRTVAAAFESVQRKRVGSLIEVRVRDAYGSYRLVEVRGRAVSHGGEAMFVLGIRDISDRHRWDVAAGDARLLRTIVDNAPTITMLLDAEGRLRGASRALTNALGYDLADVLGLPLAQLAVPAHQSFVSHQIASAAAQAGTNSFEAVFRHAERGARPLSVALTNLLADRSVNGIVAVAADITDLTETRERLEHLATHDSLTGLPNRALLHDRLAQALAVARRRGTFVAVAFCDLDTFKEINDEHGHAAGDRVLVEVARRLRRIARASDTVARLSGDEFVLVVEDQRRDAVSALVERISDALAAPFELGDGVRHEVAASVGVVVDDGTSSPESLLASADAAMYSSKRRRR